MRFVIVFALALVSSGCFGFRRPASEPLPAAPVLTLIGQFSIAPQQRIPPSFGLQFGGISGLASAPRNGDGSLEFFGISDAQRGGRIYRLALGDQGAPFRVDVGYPVTLEGSGGEVQADFEAVGVLPNGHFLVAAEGTGREPRRPPMLEEYDPSGALMAHLPIPDRYVPEITGPLTRGARGNAGFESLAVAPGGESFFTGLETALVQDDDPANFDRGTRTRLLEYKAAKGTFRPAREFVYEIDKLERPPYAPGFYINGLVELLVVNRTTLLALERGYVESSAEAGTGLNSIRLYRVSLSGATDVSKLDSIKNRPDVVPVQKTLLVDVSKATGLDGDLAPSLDNFEGMAFGPRLPDGRPTLILVSDDNFSARQRTWFLQFAIGSGARELEGSGAR